MAVTKKEFKVLSSDGIHTLSGIVLYPNKEAVGFFHIVHGMTEHIARYERFMCELCEEGWICFGYDNLGHGGTVNDDSELGYIAKKDGWDLLCRDVKIFSDAVIADCKKDHGASLPYCLMGHSMGSFIARLAAQKYVRPDKLIIMGTGGANPAADAGLTAIGLIKLFKGDRHISKFIDKLAFGNYNKRFGGGSAEDPSPWLTSDIEVRKRYYANKYCTFKFTVSAMGDLIRVMKYSNISSWYKKIPDGMPILLVSGEDDPVGNYGKGVLSVYNKLKANNKNAECILYKGARHEILNDFVRDDVKRDIIEFANKRRKQ